MRKALEAWESKTIFARLDANISARVMQEINASSFWWPCFVHISKASATLD
jgi:hypothetical protein